MKITSLNKKQLNEFISSDEFEKMPDVPISRHRALSQINNPRAQPDDVLLMLCYNDAEKMVGYIGVLPDQLQSSKSVKVGWLSCLWVDPDSRGKGVAKRLLSTAMQAWEGKLLMTEFTPVARGLYDRSNLFTDLAQREGIRCYLRFNSHKLLPKKSRIFKALKPLLEIGDVLGNNLNELRLQKKVKSAKIQFEMIGEVDDKTIRFIASKQPHELTQRSREELNWIIEHPWILEAPMPERFEGRYDFSAYAEQFQVLNLKLYDSSKQHLVGYMMLTLRNGNMKTPYLYVDKEYASEAAALILHLMVQLKAEMITTYQSELIWYLEKEKDTFLFRKKQYRHYLISKALAEELPDGKPIKIQDGEGDVAFT